MVRGLREAGGMTSGAFRFSNSLNFSFGEKKWHKMKKKLLKLNCESAWFRVWIRLFSFNIDSSGLANLLDIPSHVANEVATFVH